MIISKMRFEEKTFTFKVELDSKESLQISYECYEKYSLSTGQEVDDDLLQILRDEDQLLFARQRALRYIDYKARSEFEVKNKLKSLSIKDDIIDRVLIDLSNKGYLNDEDYAKEFFRQCLEFKKYSLLATKQKLFQKGIRKDIINNLMAGLNIDSLNLENARYHAKKKLHNKDLNDLANFQKMYRYLLSKGFDYDTSKKVLYEIKNDKSD